MTAVINPLSQQPRRAGWRNATGWAVVLSVAAHLLIALAMLTARAPLEPPADDPPILVTLYDPPPSPPPPPPPSPSPEPQPAPAAQAPADPAPAAPSPRPAPKIRVHVPRTVVAPIPPVHLTPAPVSQPFATLSDGQLRGAVTAGSGAGGDGEGADGGAARCDMVERLQSALRRDPDIAAVVEAVRRGTGGRALHVWNGDWVQTPGQAGKGLAGLRQAIAMEVAFAPAACRAQPVRGLVLITLGDGAGASRLAIGTGAWRWTDLLAAHR